MKKPVPDVVEIEEMDLFQMLDYLEFKYPGTKQTFLDYYTKLGFIENNQATYFPLPDKKDFPELRAIILQEYKSFETICFNIFFVGSLS